ncbi:MAG: RNA-binding S4 domain-containing protein [Rickettsiales bacterium]|jgi:ribosome-associated heat shock protein Hsp15
MAPDDMAAKPPRIRVDKWLWYARFFKSRTLAAKVAEAGQLRVNREIVRKSGHALKPGDILTFAKGRDIRVVEVIALGDRRGPASEAQTLYKDLSPPVEKPREPLSGVRERGAGRPTKSDRRALDRLQARSR